MSARNPQAAFVGIQISPISFVDEGVDAVLDTLQRRVGVNVLMLGTVSWLGLKSGRSVSHALDGWPDHGVPEPYQMRGGAYFDPDPRYYRDTFMADFRSRDPEFAGRDILKMVVPAAHARGMQVYIELMEPFFRYAGHGSAAAVEIPTLAQALEVDLLGRFGSEPSTSNPGYRRWIHSMVEDQVRNHAVDGVMWCNERSSPLDTLIQGGAPGDFSPPARREAAERGVNVEACRQALLRVYDFMQEAAAGKAFADGTLLTFLRVLLDNPEALVWEKFWLERNKDLDRELYGLVKWCRPELPFGLNVWNRNHFSLLRRAQWPWAEQTRYADFVKPITYQHQAGEVWVKELGFLRKTVLRDVEPGEATTALFRILGLNEAPYDEIVAAGMDPDTYVYGQCADALRGVAGRAKVYMGIGVDAPRTRADTARCSADLVRRSVLATFRAGGHGVVLAPNYASMHLTHLDGVAAALAELGAAVTLPAVAPRAGRGAGPWQNTAGPAPVSHLISIIVPVYNEARTVAAVIDRLLTVPLPAAREIVVVNDGSTDGTRAVLEALPPQPGVLDIVHAARNGGKGSAIRTGFARARGTIFAIQDADLELDPAQLGPLVQPIIDGRSRVVYGSRFLAGRPEAPLVTVLANRFLTGVTNLLYGARITDMETCYKIMAGDVARGLTLEANRFDIEPEITARLLKAGHRILELPVAFQPRSRAQGKKIGWRDGVHAVQVLVRHRFRA